jgi:antibiotic biosynthesis monooxygenase (ABM) superfamily enzyme
MIITVFRSRLMPGVREEYLVLVDRMVKLAETMPGYISHKGFFAEARTSDGG